MRVLVILFSVYSFYCFSQTTDSTTEVLCKKWVLINIEEFGQEYEPKPEQIGDWFLFSEDKTIQGLMGGVSFKGNWSVNSGNKINMSASKDSEAKVNWIRLDKIDEEELRITYQAPSLIKTTLILEPEEAQ